jgi:hypothetical protein
MHAEQPTNDTTAPVATAKTYFARVDAGDPTLLEMFTEDVQAYFPKIGTTRGKIALANLVQALTAALRSFVHYQGVMIFTQAGDRLVVEGTQAGIRVPRTPHQPSAHLHGPRLRRTPRAVPGTLFAVQSPHATRGRTTMKRSLTRSNGSCVCVYAPCRSPSIRAAVPLA